MVFIGYHTLEVNISLSDFSSKSNFALTQVQNTVRTIKSCLPITTLINFHLLALL